MSLMEMFLSLLLMGMISALLASTLFESSKQKNRMSSELEFRQETRIILRFLKNDLQSTVYLSDYVKSGSQEDRKSGILLENLQENNHTENVDADKLYMHVRHKSVMFKGTDAKNDPGLHEVGYYLEPLENNLFRLMRREEFYIDSDITGGERSRTAPISEHIASLNFEFLQESQDDRSEEWLQEWDSKKYSTQGKYPLPIAVKITLEMGNEKKESFKEVMEINLSQTLLHSM